MDEALERLRDVKIFGERNTSTNALKLVVERNSASRVLPSVAAELDPRFESEKRRLSRLPNPKAAREAYIDGIFRVAGPRHAWKHAAPNFDDLRPFAGCLVILTFRHPASWLLALHRHPYHALRPVAARFADFLQEHWPTVERDRLGSAATTPIGLYNAKVATSLAFAGRLAAAKAAHVLVRFEDFVADQHAVFETLAGHLVEPAKHFAPLDQSTKEPGKDRGFYQRRYGQNLWLSEISDEAGRLIDQGIDWSLADQLGYRPLSSFR